MLKKHNTYEANYDSDYDDLDDSCVAVITNFESIEPVNMQTQFGNRD